MTIISIDFSVLYPGVAITRDFKTYEWLAVVNSNTTKKHNKNLQDFILKYPSIDILFTESRRQKNEIYHITERTKLNNYIEAIDLLIDELKTRVIDPKDTIIAIEGISFGSNGNSLVDISQATGIIKYKLVKELLNGDTDRFFVFSPSELKNAIGCKGNANKQVIFDKFKTDPILESVKTSDLYKATQVEEWFLDNKDKVVSPIMDMVDAYLGIVKVHNILK